MLNFIFKMAMINSNHVSALPACDNSNKSAQSSPGAVHRKPIRLRNVSTKAETFDALHSKSNNVSGLLAV